jgi:hypothetical protein
VLQPLVEAASLQEEPDLQNVWANLLANAADGRQMTPVEPSFVAMLRNLSSREVRFLESICEGLFCRSQCSGDNQAGHYRVSHSSSCGLTNLAHILSVRQMQYAGGSSIVMHGFKATNVISG